MVAEGEIVDFDNALACVREASPDLLVLLGDVKHSIPITTRQEYRELPDALEAFRSLAPIRVVPGNHDGGIERFLGDGELLPAKGAVIDGVGYLHGHTAPSEDLLGRLILLGHLHPVVSVRDDVGCAMRDRVYLSGEFDPRCLDMEPARTPTRILVLPAFNEFAGYDVLRRGATALGPIARCMNYDDTDVILPDGTYLGPIRTLQPPDGP